MSVNEIESRVAELQELKRMAEELSAEICAAEDSIKAEMTSRNVDTLTAGAWRVTWKLIESSRLDGKKLRAELPDIADRFTVKTSTRRFCVA